VSSDWGPEEVRVRELLGEEAHESRGNLGAIGELVAVDKVTASAKA
jgi:hypothetical protein